MSDTPSFYSCGNEFGTDPCIFARENRKIPAEEAVPSLDGGGGLKCPGKTLSGKDCGSELTPLPDITPWWKKTSTVAGIVAFVTFLAGICTIYGVFCSKQAELQLQIENTNCHVYVLTPPDGVSKDIVDGRIDIHKKEGSIKCYPPPNQPSERVEEGRINIILKNVGKKPLKLNKIQMSSDQFSPMTKVLIVEPGESKTLPIQFKSTSDEMLEGILTLKTNDPDTPLATIRLAVQPRIPVPPNLDPWWVYQQLETSSTILRTEP